MATALEAKAIISAEDRTAKVFAAIEARVARLNAMFAGFGRMTGLGVPSARYGRADPFARMENATVRLTRSLDTMDRSVRALNRSTTSGDGLSRRNRGDLPGGHVLGLGAGFAAVAVVHEVIKSSAERGHEESRMNLAGMTPAEIREANLAAADLSAKVPVIGQNDLMHMLRNARSIVGSYKEAAEIIEPLAKLRVLAQAARPGQDVTEDFDQLVKGLEIKGVTQNPKMFKEYMNGIAKGLNVFGDTLKASDYYQMFLYGRQATPGLSEDFILSTAPTLAQELRGSSYGRAVAGFNRAIVGGRMTGASMHEMARLGLVAPDALDKKGALKPGRGMEGWELAQSNPNEWVKKYLMPALRTHGIENQAAVLKEVGELFSNQVAAQMVGLLATQQSRIDKDHELIHRAPGIESADAAMRNDPLLAWTALKESLANLLGTVGVDFAKGLAPYMADLSVALNRLNASFQRAMDFHLANPDSVSPEQKKFNTVMNRTLFGGDGNDKSLADITDADRLQGEYERQRRGLADGSARRPIVHKYRGPAPKGFEDSFAALDRLKDEEDSGAYDPAPEIASLDSLNSARLKAQGDLDRFNRRLRGLVMGLNGPYADKPFSPFIAGSPTEQPLATGWGVPRRTMDYGFLDPQTGAPKVMGPPAPPAQGAPTASGGKQSVSFDGSITLGGTIDVKVPAGWEARLTRLEAQSSSPLIQMNLGPSRADTDPRNGRR